MLNIIDTPTRRQLPARQQPVRALILHNTGDTDLDKILEWYTRADGEGPHYFIETIGTVRRIAPEDRVAWHCKIEAHEARLYSAGWQTWSTFKWVNGTPLATGAEFPGYREWRETWQQRGYDSPLEHVTGWHPNLCSMGIELQNPVAPTRDLYTDAQYAALAELLVDLSSRWHVPLRRTEVLGHYDVSPMRRCSAAGNWDPGAAMKWARIWDMVRTAA